MIYDVSAKWVASYYHVQAQILRIKESKESKKIVLIYLKAIFNDSLICLWKTIRFVSLECFRLYHLLQAF